LVLPFPILLLQKNLSSLLMLLQVFGKNLDSVLLPFFIIIIWK
jgi:hypothetical protein